MELTAKRDYGYDNIRFILILSVVVGHLLEFCKAPGHNEVYRLIYLFHMPAFLFVCGRFSGKKATKHLFREFFLYLLFQTAYIYFDNRFLGKSTAYQYTTPYWILWFSLALLFYHVLTPLYETERVAHRWVALGITVALALLAGYDKTIGYYTSLSRFFVFQPFYLLGLYGKDAEPVIHRFLHRKKMRWFVAAGLSVAAAGLSLFLVYDKSITSAMLYGSYSYSRLSYGIAVRGKLLLAALAWIAFFVIVCKPLLNRSVLLVSTIGANTLPIFLFHGFFMRLLKKHHTEDFDGWLFVICVALILLIVFGNPIFSAPLRLSLPSPSQKGKKSS